MTNLLFERPGKLLSFKDYEQADGFKTLKCVLDKKPQDLIDEIKKAKLLGRGGAGFPVGLKMQFVADESSDIKYIICNADEGEPGTFKDRELLRRNPLKVIEAMIIAAYAIGASKGYLYVRGEYTNIKDHIEAGIKEARQKNYLGPNIMGTGFSFDLEYRSGVGAYICGEETALIESIEGRAGDPRQKPPYTAQKGLFNKPTLVHNVETLVNLLPIMQLGAATYTTYGTEASTGTKLFSVSGFVKNKGVFEVAFGLKLSDLIKNQCQTLEAYDTIKFIQVGGSSGVVLPRDLFDIQLSYEAFKAIGANLGSGAIFVADESICILDFLKATANFFRHESCGKCTPCREGNRHISMILDKISQGQGTDKDLGLLKSTCEVMKSASFCGLGQTAPTAILSVIKYFKDELQAHIGGQCYTGACSMKGGDLHV